MIVAPTRLANSASRPSNASKETRGSLAHGRAQHVQPLLDREERLLGDVDRDGHDDPVGQREAPADQVLVALRRRIERAGIDRRSGSWARSRR